MIHSVTAANQGLVWRGAGAAQAPRGRSQAAAAAGEEDRTGTARGGCHSLFHRRHGEMGVGQGDMAGTQSGEYSQDKTPSAHPGHGLGREGAANRLARG